jgi:beta-glucanase (GH16 family)
MSGEPSDNDRWCEIDIFEGGRPHIFWNTVHDWRGKSSHTNTNYTNPLPKGTQLTEWHTYAALWKPGQISWYFDDKLVATAASPAVCDQQSAFLILSSQRRKNGIAPESLDVDWVHVYR